MSPFSVPNLLVVVLVGGGVFSAYTELLSPQNGFFLFFMGLFFAALTGIGLAGAAAFAATTNKPWRRRALHGAVVPLVVTGAALAYVSRNNAPIMNDISTDLQDRPRLGIGGAEEPDVAASADDGLLLDAFAELQREHYPDLQPLVVPLDPSEAFRRAVLAAQRIGIDLERANPHSGHIEGHAYTSVFRFTDDVTIRVRPQGDGSRVDVRSRSRQGLGDFGANAARIREFFAVFATLREPVPPRFGSQDPRE